MVHRAVSVSSEWDGPDRSPVSVHFSLQTKMVQHIRKKHPEFAQLANSIQAPLATAVISSAPAVITADGTAAEAVVVRERHDCIYTRPVFTPYVMYCVYTHKLHTT